MRKFFATALVSALLALPGIGTAATGVLYDCDISKKSRGGWISEKMGIVVDQAGRIFVTDSVTLQFENGPVSATRGRETDRVLVVNWFIEGARNGSNQYTPRFNYSAKINKNRNRITVSAKPANYNNKFSGSGSCVVRTGK